MILLLASCRVTIDKIEIANRNDVVRAAFAFMQA